MADPNVTVVANSTAGPIAIAAYDAVHKTPWFQLRTYDVRDGAGSFLTFMTPDSSGKVWDSVMLNGGFWLNNAKGPSSCLDIVGFSNGTGFLVTMAGEGRGDPAVLEPGPSEFVALGTRNNRWLELWLKEYPPRPGMPSGVKRCVKINGGYVPIYD